MLPPLLIKSIPLPSRVVRRLWVRVPYVSEGSASDVREARRNMMVAGKIIASPLVRRGALKVISSPKVRRGAISLAKSPRVRQGAVKLAKNPRVQRMVLKQAAQRFGRG
jgi:hypothetical protein